MSDSPTTDDGANEKATDHEAQAAEIATDGERAGLRDQGGLTEDAGVSNASFSTEKQQTVEKGGGGVRANTTTPGERAVERVRIQWGCNDSKKYDGKVEDVPSPWVTEGTLTVGGTVTIDVGGEKQWSGTVLEIFYEKNPLDLALPVKRS